MAGDWTFHGGRLSQARAAYGGDSGDWTDLSTGINPHAWPGAGRLDIDWHRLPDEGALRTLEAVAAAFFGVDPAFVAALPGTEIGLRTIADLLPGPARHMWPAYRTHGEMFGNSTATAADAIDDLRNGTVLLANPNNPDGRIVARDRLIRLLDRLRVSAGWMVLDEAFADPAPECSLADHVGDGAPLVVFRSFGKFFGLAGVRLGFVLGPRAVIGAIRARLGAWPVSAAAIAIGTAAYGDAAWIAAMRRRLRREAALLDRMLAARGFRPIGHCTLFRLIETEDAAALFDRLARAAILSRPFDYDRRWLRIGLPVDARARARLDRALARD